MENNKPEFLSKYAIDLNDLRQKVEDLKIEAAAAERAGDYGKVAQIRYGSIAEIVARWTGIPVNRMLESERDKLLRMEETLHRRVVGQDKAIVAVSDAVRRRPGRAAEPVKEMPDISPGCLTSGTLFTRRTWNLRLNNS